MNKRLRIISLLLLALFSVSRQSYAQQLQQDPALRKGVLKNGLTYYIYPNNNPAGQSVLRLFVNAGSLQEEPDQQGLAHFVEHMAFNGTKNYSKNEVISFLESKGVKFGADLNAHTSFDETVYKIAINTEDAANMEKAIGIMADWAFNISFDSLEIEKERGVVIEEWRSKQGAANRLRDQYLPVLFHESRYAERMPIGKVDILKSFPRQRIVDFYEKWYRPELMAVAIITNLDTRKVEKMIRKQFAHAKNRSHAERIYYSLKPHEDTLVSIVTDKEATATEFSFFTKLPSLTNIKTESDFKQYLLRVFLNNLSRNRYERISRLQDEFKEGSLSVSNLIVKNAVLAGGASLYNGREKEGIKRYLAEMERIFRFGYTNDEIEKLKKDYLQQLERAASADKTQSSSYAEAISDDFYNGNTLLSKKEKLSLVTRILPAIDSVSLLQSLRSFRTPGNTVLLITAPEKEKNTLPAKEELAQLVARAPFGSLHPWEDYVEVPDKLLPQQPVAGQIIAENFIGEIGVTEWKLSNGTTVYLKRSGEDKDNIMLSGFRQGGIYAVDSSLYITALFTKNIVAAGGAGNFSRQALTRYLSGNSASATMVLSNSREGVVAGADWKDVKDMFELLYLKWTAPRLDTNAFRQIRQKAIEAGENGKLSPTYSYNRKISRLLGGDDYVSDNITAKRISQELQPNDILPVFRSRFGSARGFQFVIVGNFEPDSLRPLVERYLGGLPGGEYHTEYVYKGASGGDREENILEYAGEAPRSTVNLFFQSTDLHYDYPVIMKQQLLEEVLKVKLRLSLREENSGVYGVGVSLSSTNKPAELLRARISFTCAPEAVEFLTTQALAEIDHIAKDPSYFATELDRIRVQQIDQYKKQQSKNSFWSAALRNHFYHDFSGWEYFTNYEKLLADISPEMISAFAQKYLKETPCIKAVLMPADYKNSKQTVNHKHNQ